MPTLTRKNDLICWVYLSEIQQRIYQDFTQTPEVQEVHHTIFCTAFAHCSFFRYCCDIMMPSTLRHSTCEVMSVGYCNNSRHNNCNTVIILCCKNNYYCHYYCRLGDRIDIGLWKRLVLNDDEDWIFACPRDRRTIKMQSQKTQLVAVTRKRVIVWVLLTMLKD